MPAENRHLIIPVSFIRSLVAILTGVGGLCDIVSRKEYCSAKKVF